jgi:CDP-glucose 4,6-dehydratase
MKHLEHYKGKKIFLTGHTGFKGSWMLALLNKLGAIVKGYALAPEHSQGLYSVIHGDTLSTSVIADIRDKERLEKELISFAPDFIFHLAAQPLVRRSFDIPSETFEVNVVGTSNVLEASSALKKKCTIIIITTDKVYENIESDYAYTEVDQLGGYDPYSASKACAELVVSSFRRSFFNIQNYAVHQKGLASVRAGNVIGGGDFSVDRIIPDLINSLKKDQPLHVRNPSAIRPWQHVLEPIVGYLKLGILLDADPEKYSKAYNFGPKADDHLTVESLVQEIIQVWGRGEYQITPDQTKHEAGILKLDIGLARKELNWDPIFDSKKAIQKTVNWYKSESPAETTFEQIDEYLKLLK